MFCSLSQTDARQTFWDLYQYSIAQRATFWDQAFQFLGIIYSGSYTTVVDESARIDSIPRWFEGVYMNAAENLLYSRVPGAPPSRRGTIGKEDGKVALTEVREGATEIRDVTWRQLRLEVGRLADAMRKQGVRKGDRIAVVASNSVDTLVVFLAILSIGGIFSSSSTDMGVQGVLQRMLQITPKVRVKIRILLDTHCQIPLGHQLDLSRSLALFTCPTFGAEFQRILGSNVLFLLTLWFWRCSLYPRVKMLISKVYFHGRLRCV